MKKKYNIGLDIGTTSVGWAVVEENTQKIMKKGTGNKKCALWGVRLFDSANTAKDRRMARSTRRRYDRRRARIQLLQEEFLEEINKVDKDFYKKLEESKYSEKDCVNKSILLTAKEKEKIKDYNEKYKTIYHLRNKLVTNPEREDIRLVYLAIHHIIKYRGNFLYPGENFNASTLDVNENLKACFDSLVELVPSLEIPNYYEEIIDLDNLQTAIMDVSKKDVKIRVQKLLENAISYKKFAQEFAKLVVGDQFSIKNLFNLENVEKGEDIKISFKEADMENEEKFSKLEFLLDDKIEVMNLLKELYDAVFLKKIFKGSQNSYISGLMIERYNTHKDDLRFLKDLFDSDRKLYNQLLRSNNNPCLYDEYIHNKLSYDDFRKELQKLLEKIFERNIDTKLKEKYVTTIQNRIDNGEFLPRITSSENGAFPYQLNMSELIKIIENQGKYYPFLLEKVKGKYKIVKLLEFKIPYYIGPLVSEEKSRFAWMERQIENERITPYNFDEVVNKELTAEKFIKRMISHCTYLLDEYALPNHSILYSKYKVMNELKQIKVNGTRLDNDIQHKIMEELFKKTQGSITDKRLKEYLYCLNDFSMFKEDMNITGYSADGKFANTMQSYIDFFGEDGIFKNTTYQEEEAEEIIEWITIFEDKDILKHKIKSKYQELDEKEIGKILKKKYSGWGSLSKKLLTELKIKDKKTGSLKNIITLMYETEENFMQIIHNEEYKFQDLIKDNNIIENDKEISYELVEKLATSPANKKGIYQALKLIEEIINFIGYEPENIMIETARGEESKKERKDDKKKYLLKLYQNIKKEAQINYFTNYKEVYSELKNIEKINSQKLFLYFIQGGKCLYSGKPLNIDDLNSYEVDHILPRTLTDDNSIDNKALVYRECNQIKAANFVLPSQYRTSYMKDWWRYLNKMGLLSSKKLYRLTRQAYSDEDIAGFINRQLVETRQITKHVANIINSFYKNTKVIYLKANLSHNYRERYELFKFREINDYHHAHDAYLAAILGEYKEKYMKKDINFEMVKEMNNRLRDIGDNQKLKYGFIINSLDEKVNDIITDISKKIVNEETGELLFDAKRFNEMAAKTLYRNDILISRKTEIRTGKLFKETIYKKNIGKIPIKKNMPTNIYGGYNNIETTYLVLVEYNKKKKIIGIPMEIALKSEKNENIKYDFIKEHLKLKTVEDMKIIKDKIPYESLIEYKGHNVYIKGYSIAHKNCELSNAVQLKIPVEKAKEWKYIFNKILNKRDIPEKNEVPVLTEKEIIKKMIEIVQYLYEQVDNYPLFMSAITKIKNTLSLEEMSEEDLSKIIKELLKIYQCNSANSSLKDYGVKDRIDRLGDKTINDGTIVFKSTTGIKESKYEF